MLGIEAGPDARTGGEHASLDGERLLKSEHDLVGPLQHFLVRLHVFDQYSELVAAKASQQRTRAGCRAQPLGHELKNTVAEVVSERIVDRLEVVEVHEQQRELLVRGTGAGQRSCKSRGKLPAVG